MPFFADYVDTQNTAGLAMTSTVQYQEFRLSKQRVFGIVSVAIVSPSSLVGGAIALQMYDELTSAWIAMPQEITLISGGAGATTVNGNTSTATPITGSVVKNSTGVTGMSGVAQFLITYNGYGKLVRLAYSLTTGTANLTFDERGLTAVG